MRRLAPAFALFFLAPLVAEFFLGDFPIVLLPLIVALAPMYGGAALLIRELVHRAGRGWPSILVLGLAFGVLQEGLLIQSLFNPNYLDLHLLDPGFIPALGIGLPWTVYVLTLHTLWSIGTPIEVVEESTVDRRAEPWLGNRGLIVAVALFLIGCVITFATTYGPSHHFMATPAQLGVSAAVVVVLVVLAFRLPRVDPSVARPDGAVPGPWLLFGITAVAGGLFMGGIALPVGIGVPVMLVSVATVGVLVALWSRRSGWGRWHRFALAGGALFTYAWHAFTMGSGSGTAAFIIGLVSHVIYALAALSICWLANRRIRRTEATPVDNG
jgi:hypothetical protein